MLRKYFFCRCFNGYRHLRKNRREGRLGIYLRFCFHKSSPNTSFHGRNHTRDVESISFHGRNHQRGIGNISFHGRNHQQSIGSISFHGRNHQQSIGSISFHGRNHQQSIGSISFHGRNHQRGIGSISFHGRISFDSNFSDSFLFPNHHGAPGGDVFQPRWLHRALRDTSQAPLRG